MIPAVTNFEDAIQPVFRVSGELARKHRLSDVEASWLRIQTMMTGLATLTDDDVASHRTAVERLLNRKTHAAPADPVPNVDFLDAMYKMPVKERDLWFAIRASGARSEGKAVTLSNHFVNARTDQVRLVSEFMGSLGGPGTPAREAVRRLPFRQLVDDLALMESYRESSFVHEGDDAVHVRLHGAIADIVDGPMTEDGTTSAFRLAG